MNSPALFLDTEFPRTSGGWSSAPCSEFWRSTRRRPTPPRGSLPAWMILRTRTTYRSMPDISLILHYLCPKDPSRFQCFHDALSFSSLKDLNWQRLHVTSVDHALMIQREINIVLYVLDFKWSDWAYKMRKYEHDQLIVIACPTPIKASISSLWRVKFGELLRFYHNICFLL